jgi:hypothetical protein
MGVGVMRDEDEIRDQMNEAADHASSGKRSKWPGMSYEDGVLAALSWALGDEETPPMTEEQD